MREIIFRGKRTDSNEWVYGNLLHYNSGEIAITNKFSRYGYEATEVCRRFKVLPETVGQYTGLTDKKGKKIFEGDIFKFADEVWSSFYTSCGTEYDSCAVKNYGVVGFDEDNARFDFVKYKFYENSVEADLHENHDIVFSEFVSELEVIGNIHDSPELLNLDREDCEE